MLKSLVSLPDFPELTGCIFMELPSYHQPLMDKFFNLESLDTDIIIRISQDEQLNGWWDIGEFEFICELWKLNHSLPQEKKIRVVLADYQIPYSTITKRE